MTFTITEQNIHFICEHIVANFEHARITPRARTDIAARFPNAESTGWIDFTVLTLEGVTLEVELHADRIEAWTADYAEGVIVDYCELPPETLRYVRMIFGYLLPDERAALGFSEIEA